MKISLLSLITGCIFISLFSIIFYNTQAENTASEIKKQYAVYVTEACRDAVHRAYEASENEGKVFDNAGRKTAVSTFFKTLEESFDRSGIYADELKIYVPALIMIDNDGFYVYYDAGRVTELKTWTEYAGKYVVKYGLTDTVTVTDTGTGMSVSGERTQIYEIFEDDTLLFLNGTDEFNIRRRSVIIEEVEYALTYYINNRNYYNAYGRKYDIDFSCEEWDKILSTPTVMAFLQGKQLKEAGNDIILNIHSYAGTETIEPYSYFVRDGLYYCIEQLLAQGELEIVGGEYYYRGEEVGKMYGSMEACANDGAYPAPYGTGG